jgi:hypothetical protein
MNAVTTSVAAAALMAPGTDTTGQVGMTLAAIAYAADATAIAGLLGNATLATQGRWSLLWYGVDTGNQVFVARDTQSGQYAIAIRGSVSDPRSKAFWIDWFGQDFSVFRQVSWPYGGAPAAAKISQGSLLGLNSLLSLKNGSGQTLMAFLRADTQRVGTTAVIGHSLGGDLASVLAAYLHQEFSPGKDVLDFWPLTFAGPTAGNAAFAGWLAGSFAATQGRYFNSLDVVPRAWAGLAWIDKSFPAGPQVPLLLRAPFDALTDFIKLIRADYTQPGDGIELTGVMAGSDDWFQEAGAQHAGQNYLKLLGAPAVPNGSS